LAPPYIYTLSLHDALPILLLEHAPTVYQVVNGQRQPLTASYNLTANDELKFVVNNYDQALPLVIDPVLVYSSYLGGSDMDRGHRDRKSTRLNSSHLGISYA